MVNCRSEQPHTAISTMKKTILNTLRTGLLLAGLITASSLSASTLSLTFTNSGGTILDRNGVGTGLTARMPGTGSDVSANDTNLTLNTAAGVLTLHTSPGADFNGQAGMSNATVVGLNLSSLGFHGTNDFVATANFINITNRLLNPDQLCLVVGTDSSNLVRGGFINFSQFHATNTDANEYFGVNTGNGIDSNPRFFGSPVGSNMTVVISRIGGNWAVTVNGADRLPNTQADGSGSPAPPTSLNAASDLFVGVVAMDVFNDSQWNADLDTFTVNVIESQTKPVLTSQPHGMTVYERNLVSMSVSVTSESASPRTFQWRRNGVDIPQTSSLLNLYPLASEAGDYTVVVSNPLGSVTSSVAPVKVIVPIGTFARDFSAPSNGITDFNGIGTGLPTRLPGTGSALATNDPNLFIDGTGNLEIFSTSSDFNGGNGMDVNESLGVSLNTIGFTGTQDLNAWAIFPLPFPSTAQFDQFGIVIGESTLAHTRAGSITFAAKERYSENVNTNASGVPVNTGGQYFGFGFNASIPMTVLINRTAGVWHYFIDGVQWDVLAQPTFLNDRTNLTACIFAEDVVNGVHKIFNVDQFETRVFNKATLNAHVNGANLDFDWNVVGSGLEQNTDLSNPAGWTPVPGTATSPASVPLSSASQKFYRIAP